MEPSWRKQASTRPIFVIAGALFCFSGPAVTRAQSPQGASPTLSPEELQVYQSAHTVIDWTPKEIRASGDLKSSPLQNEHTRVDFAPVNLPETPVALMLPKRTLVDLWLKVDASRSAFSGPSHGRSREYDVLPQDESGQTIQHLRNIHVYSDYELFRANTRIGPTS